MKRITSILSLVIVLAMAFSMTAFAAENTNEFTVTTNATSAKAGDSVIVDVELAGDFTDVAMVQLSVVFDNEKFSTVTSGRAPWGFDKDWYNSTKDGNPANLGYINTPSFGANPANQINVLWLSTDGYYIDDAGELYGDGKTTTAAKIKFTALADVDVIDASCFEVINAKVEDTNGVAHTVTVNQIVSEEIGGEEGSELVATANKEAVTANATYQIGTAVGMTATAPEGVAFTKMIWAIANGADRLYSKVVELPNVSGEFSVAATFVNGTHNANYADAEVVESIAISADDFDAIFTDGTNDYFTNDADAANKAE